MDTTGLLALLLAITAPSLATSMEYQPIKITVNENFNAPPGVAQAHGTPALGPSYVHQGANFFFNPQIQFPVGLMPPHVETVVATKPDIAFEEEVITEILKPLKPLPAKCIEEEIEEDIKITEIVVPRPVEVLPTLPVPKPVEVIVEEHFNHPPHLVPGGIPEPPTLPPPAVHIIPPVITEEVIVKEPSEVVLPCAVEVHEHPALSDEPIAVLPPLPMPPVLPPVMVPEIHESVVVEEVVEPCAVEVHERPVILPLPMIPMPVIPPVVVPEIHEAFVVQEILEPKPCVEEVAIEEENIVPMLISKPQEVILGIINAVPVINQLPSFGSIVEAIKPRGFDRYYELPAFEHNHKVRKSLVPLPNLNLVVNPNLQEGNRIEYSTYCAHGIVAERIAPNIMMKGQTPKLLKLMSTRSAH